ncbi:hypothetical protein EV361DRAFT_954283 [Lentinula raphanica]|nr:hypothetical protein EV361DRAFT_954283 [Lentinula raphanica]
MVQSSRCVVIIFFAFLANSNVTQVVTDPVTSPRRAEIQQYPPRLVRPVTTVYQYIPNVLLGDGQPKTHEIEARLPAEWIRKNIGRLSKDQREIFLHETQAERLTVIEANMDVFRTTGEKSLLKLYKEGGFPEIPLDDDVERVALERMELEVLLARKPFQKRLDNLLLTNHK